MVLGVGFSPRYFRAVFNAACASSEHSSASCSKMQAHRFFPLSFWAVLSASLRRESGSLLLCSFGYLLYICHALAQIERFRIENASRGDGIIVVRTEFVKLPRSVHDTNAASVTRVRILVTATPRRGRPHPTVVVRDGITILAVLVTGQDKNKVMYSAVSSVAVVCNKVNGMRQQTFPLEKAFAISDRITRTLLVR